MAFQFKVFKQRTLTALLFAIVMLAGILINQWTFLVLFLLIQWGCWQEYFGLISKFLPTPITLSKKQKWVVQIINFSITAVFINNTYFSPSVYIAYIFWSILITACFILSCMIFIQPAQAKDFKIHLTVLLKGSLYISVPIALLLCLRAQSNAPAYDSFFGEKKSIGYFLGIYIVLTMWANDSFAYLIGSWIGKTPLSKISPKKTWEGTVGGILLTTLLLGYAMNYQLSSLLTGLHVNAYIFVSLGAIMGVIGDLYESQLKRKAGVKDSGNILPGHGGFLDRFDSLLFAAPAVWLYYYMVTTLLS